MQNSPPQCSQTRSVADRQCQILPPVVFDSARLAPRPRAPRAARPRRTLPPLLARSKARCNAMSALSPSPGGMNGGSGFCAFIEDFLDANPGAVAQAALWCADDAPGADQPPGSADLVASLPAPPFSDFMCRTSQSADASATRRAPARQRQCPKTKSGRERQCRKAGREARRTSPNSQSEGRVACHASGFWRNQNLHLIDSARQCCTPATVPSLARGGNLYETGSGIKLAGRGGGRSFSVSNCRSRSESGRQKLSCTVLRGTTPSTLNPFSA